jgi:ABC-type Mn2+/Zn2+ transport system ATPase subunit
MPQNYLCLQVCADTVVGDAMLRGISGGQKKRVTTAEMVVGPKKTLFLDEISTGLVHFRRRMSVNHVLSKPHIYIHNITYIYIYIYVYI